MQSLPTTFDELTGACLFTFCFIRSSKTDAASVPAATTPFPVDVLVQFTPSQVMQWQKLCKQNPSESPETLLEYVRLQAMLGGNTGTAPEEGGSSGTGSGGQQQHSSVGAKAEGVATGQKRWQEADSTKEDVYAKRPKKHNKDAVRDDEEAKRLFEHMVRVSKEYVDEKLPVMNRAVLSCADQLATYKQRLGVEVGDGDLFGNDALRTKLLKSNGKYTVLFSRLELREYLCSQNHPLTTRFYL